MNLIKTRSWHLHTNTGKYPQTIIWDQINDYANKHLKITPLNVATYTFEGGGFTGIILLSESHLAYHSWPEVDYIWVELASCGSKEDFVLLEEFFVKNENILFYTIDISNTHE